jgi:hypothetical protein
MGVASVGARAELSGDISRMIISSRLAIGVCAQVGLGWFSKEVCNPSQITWLPVTVLNGPRFDFSRFCAKAAIHCGSWMLLLRLAAKGENSASGATQRPCPLVQIFSTQNSKRNKTFTRKKNNAACVCPSFAEYLQQHTITMACSEQYVAVYNLQLRQLSTLQ